MYLAKRELSRAVLIGTGDFQSPDLPRLPAVKNNLIALYQALTHPETGILPEDNCEMVQDPDTPDSLMERLARTAEIAEDLLFVYYAGHGLRHHRRDDDLYLTVRQTRQHSLDGTAVKYDWVREVIADCSARTRLLILDCCYSGLALDRMSGAGVDSQELTVSGTAVLASSPRNKTSHSPAGERYTGFTGELLHCLKHGSPLSGEPLTVQNAYKSLRAGLARRELPRPILRTDDTSGEVLLRREPKLVPPQPIPPAPKVAQPPQSVPAVVELLMSAQVPPAVVRSTVVPEVSPPRPIVARPRDEWVHTAAPVQSGAGPGSAGPVPPAVDKLADLTDRLMPVAPPATSMISVDQSKAVSPTVRRYTASLASSAVPAAVTTVRFASSALFWFLAAAAIGMTTGGVAGLLFAAEYTSGDLSIGAGGLLFAALALLIPAIRARWRLRLLRTEISAMVPTLRRVPAGAFIPLLALICALALAMFLGDTSPRSTTSTTSSVSSDVGGGTMVLGFCLPFGWMLVRRWRSAHQAAAGDEG